jgi:predicted AlkP superfamily pyrophosphatase or phosphodiesterase
MKPLIVLNCVGLTPRHIGPDTPRLGALAKTGFLAPLDSTLPAVTTSAQTTMLTGVDPSQHGIVANGWYFRDLNEILFWRQSESLVQAPAFWTGTNLKVLKHFWWYAMNTSAAWTVTPRPVYHHDGSKSPDFYAAPPHLKQLLQERHKTFPLFNFWGPTASCMSTRWIAESFVTAFNETRPDVALCYLPHLDYDLQRFGPTGPHLSGNLAEIDYCVGLILDAVASFSCNILIVSEYGISRVEQACYPNRALRSAGLLEVSSNAAGELIDTGTSRAFAVCDHQLAHIYVKNPRDIAQTRECLSALPGVQSALLADAHSSLGLNHSRSGEIILLSEPHSWFAYDYWLDASRKPDFAQSVEIHKKPGYDPRELFFDPSGGRFRAMKALIRKKLGLRYILDPCPLNDTLVKGSHGLPASNPQDGAVLISSTPETEKLAPRHQRDVARIARSLLRC